MDKKLKYQTWTISQLNEQLQMLNFAGYGNRLKTIAMEKYDTSEWKEGKRIEHNNLIIDLYKWGGEIYKEMEIVELVLKEKGFKWKIIK